VPTKPKNMHCSLPLIGSACAVIMAMPSPTPPSVDVGAVVEYFGLYW